MGAAWRRQRAQVARIAVAAEEVGAASAQVSVQVLVQASIQVSVRMLIRMSIRVLACRLIVRPMPPQVPLEMRPER